MHFKITTHHIIEMEHHFYSDSEEKAKEAVLNPRNWGISMRPKDKVEIIKIEQV